MQQLVELWKMPPRTLVRWNKFAVGYILQNQLGCNSNHAIPEHMHYLCRGCTHYTTDRICYDDMIEGIVHSVLRPLLPQLFIIAL